MHRILRWGPLAQDQLLRLESICMMHTESQAQPNLPTISGARVLQSTLVMTSGAHARWSGDDRGRYPVKEMVLP